MVSSGAVFGVAESVGLGVRLVAIGDGLRRVGTTAVLEGHGDVGGLGDQLRSTKLDWLTHIVAKDLLEGLLEVAPGEHLETLVNVAGLGVGVAHDMSVKVLPLTFVLLESGRLEALEVTTDTVLLLGRVARGHEAFEEVDCVYRGEEALGPCFVPETRDDNHVGLPVALLDRLERCMDCSSHLAASELDKAAAILPHLVGPTHKHFVNKPFYSPSALHVVEVALDLEPSLGTDNIRVVVDGGASMHLGRAYEPRLRRGRGRVVNERVGQSRSIALCVCVSVCVWGGGVVAKRMME